VAENPGSLKVLHLISTLDVGGAEQNLLRLLTSMDKGAFHNEVVCMTQPGVVAARIEQTGTPVRSLGMEKGVPDFAAILNLCSLANALKPDLIQCWMYHANLLGLTLLKPGATIWNIRCSDMDLSLYGPVYQLAVKAGARLSHIPSAVIANSHAGKAVHEILGYHPRRWAVIPNGFDTGFFRPDDAARSQIRKELNIPADAFVIGLICRFDPMKDHASFFEAARLFREMHPQTHFLLAGRGVTRENPQIREIMGPAGDDEHLHLLGERGDMERIYASLDVASSASAWGEGLPNAVAEAMACGIPCVATDVGDTRLLMGDTGIVVNKSSPRELCGAWDLLARNGAEARRDMGLKARERIVQHYTQEQTTGSYEALYREIMSRPVC